MQRNVQPGEIIFREGEMGDFAYVVESGEVEILKRADHGEVRLAVLGPGSIFGEIALFDAEDMRSASARALGEATVLQTMSAESFQMLLAKCPGEMLPFLRNMIKRLRDLNRRVAEKERATTLLDNAINTIEILPGSTALEGTFAPVTIQAATLPFAIGGYQRGAEPPKQGGLELPSDGPPLAISAQHCRIERQGKEVVVVDMGSRFCTNVNGVMIGRAKPSFKAPLIPGENTLILGAGKPPYMLKIMCG